MLVVITILTTLTTIEVYAWEGDDDGGGDGNKQKVPYILQYNHKKEEVYRYPFIYVIKIHNVNNVSSTTIKTTGRTSTSIPNPT